MGGKYAILMPVMKMTKDAILELLRQHADTYVSGAELAKILSVSRTAVWKGMEQLREEGYKIDSVTNKGYRLSSGSDVLREEDIRKYLTAEGLDLRVYRTITSTNTVLKTMAEEGAPEGRCLIAGEKKLLFSAGQRDLSECPAAPCPAGGGRHKHHGLRRCGGGRGH